jgi:hypothetical protein
VPVSPSLRLAERRYLDDSPRRHRGRRVYAYLSQSSRRTQSFLIRFPERGNLIKLLSRFAGDRHSFSQALIGFFIMITLCYQLQDCRIQNAPPTADRAGGLVFPAQKTGPKRTSAPFESSSASGRETFFLRSQPAPLNSRLVGTV